MCYNWEYVHEEILVNTDVSIFNSRYFIQLFKLKSYIVNIIPETIEVPEVSLELCQTSTNNYFAKTFNG